METKFNFKSQVCTSIEQSRRLLELGLKKETADMYWTRLSRFEPWNLFDGMPLGYDIISKELLLPAWSLHRLIEMMPREVEFPLSGMPKNFHFEIHNGLVRYYNGYVCCVMEGGGYYKSIIDCIEWLIKKGYFPKEYLV